MEVLKSLEEANWPSVVTFMSKVMQTAANGLTDKEELLIVKVAAHVWNKRVVLQDKSVPPEVIWKAAQGVSLIADNPDIASVNLPDFLISGIDLGLLFTRLALSAHLMKDATEGIHLVNDLTKRLRDMVQRHGESRLRSRLEANMAAAHVIECDILSRPSQTGVSNAAQALKVFCLAMVSPGLLPSHCDYLARVAFNAGLNCRKEKKFFHAVRWLRESYRAGKAAASSSVKINSLDNSKTMCLLATTYLEWGEENWDKAVDACDVGLKERESFDLLYLRVKALMASQKEESELGICSGLNHIRQLPDISGNDLIKITKLLIDHKEYHLAMEMVDKATASDDNWHIRYRFVFYTGIIESFDKALTILEEVARRPTISSNQDGLNAIIALASDLAVQFQENKSFLQASCWYAILSEITSKTGDIGAAIQMRCNQAECLMEEGMMDGAEAVIANVNDPEEENLLWQIPIQIVKLKLAVFQGKEKEMLEQATSLDVLLPAVETHHSLEEHLADVAVKAASLKKQRECIEAMKKVAAALEPSTRLKAQKVIVRSYLQLCNEEKDKTDDLEPLNVCVAQLADFLEEVLTTAIAIQKEILNHSDTLFTATLVDASYGFLLYAHDMDDVTEEYQDEEILERTTTYEKLDDDLQWFGTLAWNVSVHKWGERYSHYRLCSSAFEFYKFVEDGTKYKEMTLALLMSISAGWELLDSLSEEQRLKVAQSCLSMVWTCRGMCEISNCWPNKMGEKFLVLYEFKCRCVLGSEDAEDMALEALKSGLIVTAMDDKSLQVLSALACKYKKYKLATRALDLALRKMELKHGDGSWSEARKAVLHSYLSLLTQDLFGNFDNEEEAFKAFKRAASYIEEGNDFTLLEAQWIMTRSWNVGVTRLHQCVRDRAQKWMQLSLSMHQSIPDLSASHRENMLQFYKAQQFGN